MTPHQKKAEKPSEQKRFEGMGRLSRLFANRVPLVDRLLARWASQPKLSDWRAEANWAELQQTPLRARALLYLCALTLFALLIWAAFAQLDEVTRGDGRVIPTSQLQVIQSQDGGVVRSIMVREGQLVEAGQPLLQLDQTRFLADVRERRARIMSLEAETARLRALTEMQPLNMPPELSELMPQLVEDQRQLYESSLSELNEQLLALDEQRVQRQQELREFQAAARQSRNVRTLAQQELDTTRPLLRSGAVSEIDILRLEREISRASGDIERAEAQIQRAEAAIREVDIRKREAQLSMVNRWRSQLAEAQVTLQALREEEAGLADRVQQTEIRAPVAGIVQRLYVSTIGGVVMPGRELIEIVPIDDQLIIEARIAPNDIAFLRPGLPAVIKLSAYDFNIFGGLSAELEHISADTITDERDNTFYLVRLRTLSNELAGDLPIIPGMTAQVDIVTGRKTVMAYLLNPVLRATREAMRER
ncbi:MAG: HlyD family type I secretion periplasmic adaptor subunit [Marinobacter sp.]|nr:HlyD family type I secretion periplasmic adaptor subunit [Marinobacter sp.]